MAEIEIGSLITGAPAHVVSHVVSAQWIRVTQRSYRGPSTQPAPTRSAPKPKPKPKKKAKPDLEALKREAESVMSSMTELPDEERPHSLSSTSTCSLRWWILHRHWRHGFWVALTVGMCTRWMQTYNQIREVIADMRALRDMGSIGDRVNQEILYPFVQSAAKDAGEFYQSITRQCKRLLPPELFEQVDLLLREESGVWR